MRESEIEAYLVRRVRECGGLCRKVQFIGRRGAPDRVVIYQGLTYWVELKADSGGKVNILQEREHKAMRLKGASVRVLHTKGKVDEFLRQTGLDSRPVNKWSELCE